MKEDIPEMGKSVAAPKETKKKSPILTIILVLFALVGIGFGVYGMFFDKTEENNNLKAEVCDQNEINDKTEENYSIYYELLDYYLSKANWEVLAGDVHNEQYMLQTVLLNDHEDIYASRTLTDATINANKLNNIIKEKFGINYEISGDRVMLTNKCLSLVNNGDGTYKIGGGCSGYESSYPKYKISKVEYTDDELHIEINFGIIFVSRLRHIDTDDSSDEWGFYVSLLNADGTIKSYATAYVPDLTDNSEIIDNDFAEEEGAKVDLEEYFYQHIDEGSKYRLTFKKSDRKFYLESGEKLN